MRKGNRGEKLENQKKKCGWGTGIRTPISGVRVRCLAIRPSPSRVEGERENREIAQYCQGKIATLFTKNPRVIGRAAPTAFIAIKSLTLALIN